MHRVSVIVPTRNRSQQLRQSLMSIRAIEGPDLRVELMVVDNGSTDDSQAVAQEFGARILRSQAQSAAEARNEALRLVSTEYVAFLDDDDVWLPGHVRPHLDLLEAQPELAAVTGQIVLADDQLQHTSAPYPSSMPADGDVFAQFLGQCPQVGATLVRTRVRDSVGYFDPDYEGGEDWDWHLRIALHHKVGFVPVPCMAFRQRRIGLTAEQQWDRLHTNRRIFFKNLQRAARRQRPSLRSAARMSLRHNGQFAAYFADHARGLFESGEHHLGLRTLGRAVLCSPLHAVVHLARPGQLRLVASALVAACLHSFAALGRMHSSQAG